MEELTPSELQVIDDIEYEEAVVSLSRTKISKTLGASNEKN